MKLRRLATRRSTPELQVLHASLNSVASSSEGSTFLVDDAICDAPFSLTLGQAPPQASASRKNVRFSDKNQVHADNTVVYDADSCAVCWYTCEDIKTFKAETVFIAKAIMEAEKRSTNASWPRRLQEAYSFFCNSEQEAAAIADLPMTKATPAIMALDKWVLRSVVQDRMERRRRLINLMEDIQDEGWTDPAEQCQRMAEVSSAISRPAQLYAAHVAKWWARYEA